MRNIIYLALICLSFSANAALDFDGFEAQLNNEIESGLKKQIVLKSRKVSDLSADSTKYERPWKLNTTLQSDAYSSDKAIPQSLPGTLSLSYQKRNGFEVRTDNQFNQRQIVNPRLIVPVQGSLTIGQEILRGGKNSPENLSAEAQWYSYKSESYLADADYLTDLQQAQGAVARLFNLHCRIQDVDLTSKTMDEVMKAAKIKLDAKALSMKDYYVLLNVSNILDREQHEYKEAIADTEILFANFGPKAVKLAQSLSASEVECLNAQNLDIASAESSMTAEELVRNMPTVVHAEIQGKAEKKRLEYYKADSKPSLVPYIGTAYYLDSPRHYNRGEAIVGIRFSYDFPGNDRNREIRAATEQIERLNLVSQQAQRDLTSEYNKFLREIEHAKNSMSVVKKSMQDSLQLIHILKVQLSLGLLDPTVTVSAYTNFLDSARLARDLWERAALARLQIRQLENAKKRSRATPD